MNNDILYRGRIGNYSSGNGWLRFREANGITVGESGETMECVTFIPSSLYLDYDKNTENVKRTAIITITQLSTGKSSAITFTQKANLAGIKCSDVYFNKTKSHIDIIGKNSTIFMVSPSSVSLNSDSTVISVKIMSENGSDDLSYSISNAGSVISLSANCLITSSQTCSETDEYGNEISSITKDYLTEKSGLTNNNINWYLTSDSSEGASLDKNILTVSANDDLNTRKYRVMAVYNDNNVSLSGYTPLFIQDSKYQNYTYTVRTNNPNTIIHIITIDPSTEIISGIAIQKDNYYEFDYASDKSNLYAYVEKESEYTGQSIIIKSGNTEILDSIHISSGGINSWIQIESSANLTIYKSDSNKDSPIKLKKDDVITINTEIDKKQKLTPLVSYKKSDDWINISPLSNNVDYSIQIGQSEENRKGTITFSFAHNIYDYTEKTIEIQQLGNTENQ